MPDPSEWQAPTRRYLHNPAEYAKTLTASAAVSSGDNKDREADVQSNLVREKQTAIWGFRREIGELNAAIQWYENCFSRVRMTVAIEADDGSRIPAFDMDGNEIAQGAKEALAHIRALRSPIGGQQQLLRALGGCLAAVGECHLVGVDDERMPTGKSFEIYSPAEFFRSANTPASGVKEYTHLIAPGKSKTVTENDAYVTRIWQPDTQFSALAWAAPLSMVDIFEELLLLTQEVAGAVKSRLAIAGLLLVADDIDFPEDESADPTNDDKADPFTAMLIKLASTAIRDKKSAAGTVPFVSRVPFDRVKDGFNLIEFNRKWDDAASAKRREGIERFAQGMDAPPEQILGHMQTTFANAAQITADKYSEYLEPKIGIGFDGLTSSYLRVLMPGSPFVIHPDPTDLIVSPDQTANYAEGYKVFAISGAAYRNSFGATEEDAPDQAELDQRIAIEQAIRVRQTVSVKEDGGIVPGIDPAVDPTIQAALEVSVMRSIDRIGSRLRSKVSGKAGLSSLIANVPNNQVAATLGQREVARLLTPTELFGREFDILEEWVTSKTDQVVAAEVRLDAIAETERRLFTPAR